MQHPEHTKKEKTLDFILNTKKQRQNNGRRLISFYFSKKITSHFFKVDKTQNYVQKYGLIQNQNHESKF